MNRPTFKTVVPWLSCGLLATAAVGQLSSPVSDDGFVFDDIAHIVQDEKIRSLPIC